MQDYIRSFIYMKSLSGGYYFNLSACWRLWEGGMVKKQEKHCVGKVRTSYRTDESPPIELNCVCVCVLDLWLSQISYYAAAAAEKRLLSEVWLLDLLFFLIVLDVK